jgi:omega-6 fatty acid desaturase (delta-12 desaturase)
VAVSGSTSASEASWRKLLESHAQPRRSRALLDIATSVVPYLAIMTGIYFALQVSLPLALALSLLSGGFLIRSFIIFHDCAHNSFFSSKRANGMLGAALSALVWLPFARWRHEHAVHHATAGDLDRRGVGDIWTLTTTEYAAGSWQRRLGYRLFRNPFVLFGLGWVLVIFLKPRVISRSAPKRIRRSVLGTNLALAGVAATLCLAIGWRQYLLLQVPTLIVTGAAGIWLFYVQHQFEDTYWQTNGDWSFDDAALHGSSYLKLPRVLQFFTGNIGFHHVHHLSAKIPNYNLAAAHEEAAKLHSVPTLTLGDAVRSSRLKLWDEELGRLVTFREAHAAARGFAGARTATDSAGS